MAHDVKLEKEFDDLLLSTKREGVDDLLEHLRSIGFYTAPCSTQFHLNYEGGLLEHSINVIVTAIEMKDALKSDVTDASIIISAGLHDIGKCGDFGKEYYIENILKSGYKSGAKPYIRNKQLINLPHSMRSIKLATLFLDLTEEEEHAILYHDGLYGEFKYNIAGTETPLYMLIHFADMWASKVIERENRKDD